MKSYVILFRGINVGLKNRIAMSALKECLEKLGFGNVASYINSGNVLLDSDKPSATVKAVIEQALPKAFKLDDELVKVLVLSHDDLKAVIGNKPPGFGEEPGKYHSDVIFLIDYDPVEAFKVFSPREDVDKVWQSGNVIYSQRLSAERTKSRLSKIMGTPAYKSMTIRTWGTATKLLAMLEDRVKT
jgi:uncharacterized protein (DUF1697 family)